MSSRSPFLRAALVLLLATGAASTASAQTTGTTPETPTPTATPAPAVPLATTGAAEAISLTGATFTATVTPGTAATTFQFEYGTTAAYRWTTPVTGVPASDGAVKVSFPVGALSAGTTYHYRVVATNAAGVARGADTTVKTIATPRVPYAQTRAAIGIVPTGAQLAARVDPRGQETSYHFEYGLTTKYGSVTDDATAGAASGIVTVSTPVIGLTPNTRYHYRVVTKNAKGTARGNDHVFTTSRTVTGVTLKAASTRVVWNRYGVLAGAVAGLGTNGVTVVLIRQDYPYTEPWRQEATQTTGASGVYSFSVGPLLRTARFQVVAKTDPTTQTSATVTLNSLLFTKLARGTSTKSSSRLTGTLYPAVPSARVSVQRKTPSGRWIRVKYATVKRGSGDTTAISATVPRLKGRTGSYRAVIVPRDGGQHVTTTTAVVHVPRR